MKVDKFANLQFQKIDAVFEDGRKLYVGFIKEKVTRQDILKKMESLAEKMRNNGKNGYIGVSAHYKHPNGWLPAMYNSVNAKQQLYNPTDSPTTVEFKDIDGMYFYFAELPEGKVLKQKMHKVKKPKADTKKKK